MSPFIHHSRRSAVTLGKGGECVGGGNTTGTWPTSTPPARRSRGRSGTPDSGRGGCVSRIDLWGLDLLCSLHSIHHSDNQK